MGGDEIQLSEEVEIGKGEIPGSSRSTMAILSHASGFKGITCDSSGFSADDALISATTNTPTAAKMVPIMTLQYQNGVMRF